MAVHHKHGKSVKQLSPSLYTPQKPHYGENFTPGSHLDTAEIQMGAYLHHS